MSENFDPRAERLANFIKQRWQSLSPRTKDRLWSFMRFLYKTKQRGNSLTVKFPKKENNADVRVKAIAPTESEWDACVRLSATDNQLDKQIDVIIPVYDGYDETLRCIYSVLSTKTNIPFNLIVIEDCSPNKKLSDKLLGLSERFGFTLIKNTCNLGFVKSTNIGMKLHSEMDVVWLNSDTEVFDFWLDRIVKVANKNNKIATITPFTNNGTIASYPVLLKDNFKPLNTPDNIIDALTSSINEDASYVEVPTGVGFCMFVRRQALNEVGFLDEENFGKGYGEENDLCQRFVERGWINVVTPNIFIRHYGGISFGTKALKRKQQADIVLKKLHPNYADSCFSWIAKDPLRAYRVKLDCARLFMHSPRNANGNILIVTHSRGGGTEAFVQKLTEQIKENGMGCFFLRPDTKGLADIESDITDYPNLHGINMSYDKDILEIIIKELHISVVHINHLIDFPPSAGLMIKQVCKKLGVKYVVSIHDYFYICPLINLSNDGSLSCPEYNEQKCINCSRERGLYPQWIRSALTYDLFSGASRLTVPSRDVKYRYNAVFDTLNFNVVPHYDRGTTVEDIVVNNPSSVTTIAVIGGINVEKGFNVITKLVDFIEYNKLPVKIVLIGYSMNDNFLKSKGVFVTGKYRSEHEVTGFLRKFNVSAILIPSVVAETYSYTLSIALRSSLPVFSFDIGAPAERLKDLNLFESIIPYDCKDEASSLLEHILKGIESYPKAFKLPEVDTGIDAYYGHS